MEKASELTTMKLNAVVVLLFTANAAQSWPIGTSNGMLFPFIFLSFFLPICIQAADGIKASETEANGVNGHASMYNFLFVKCWA